jgi:hypothetical protein
MRKWSFALGSSILVALVSAPAFAGVIYTNGPANGQTNAFGIDVGVSTADSFTVSSAATALSAIFTAWELPGDTISQIDYEILSGSHNGTVLASGTASTFDTFQYVNVYDYNIDSVAFNFSTSVSLSPGTTYWLLLQNAVPTTASDSVFWDMNNGPSSAWNSVSGNLTPGCAVSGEREGDNSCSETFSILDSAATPEPGSLALGGIGFLMLAGALRRKLRS